MAGRERSEVVAEELANLAANPWLAHNFFFPHRRLDEHGGQIESSPAHVEVMRVMHGTGARNLVQAFRGFGKSTLVEEAIVIQGAFRKFRNKLIVGASYERACERLASIKREFEQNEALFQLFGRLRGSIWQEGKITLAGGICIQALGRDQSLRGTKHLDWRPDSALVDDVEDKDEVRSPLGRKKTEDWFLKEFLPALDDPVRSKIDVLGTPMDPESLVVQLEKMGWPTQKFPIEYFDGSGERQATWEGKFPLWKIDLMKRDYTRDPVGWDQEYMLRPVSDSDRVFARDMFVVRPVERTWHAVYAMIDPARTVNRTSATTGWAVWSWIGARLHVWAAGAKQMLPDEIIDLIFAIGERFSPVWVGVEEDGLNEFILQPLRHEQFKRRRFVPVKPVRAPRSKLDFIKRLQPYFLAREVIFSVAMPELESQLLSFPTGQIDAPNALAYAPELTLHNPIYENFGEVNIVVDLEIDPTRPVYLAGNAGAGLVVAALVQFAEGRLLVIRDWVVEGAPAERVAEIQDEAALMVDSVAAMPRANRYDWTENLKLPVLRSVLRRPEMRWVVPPHHGDAWNNVGLEQAIRLVPGNVARGGAYEAGRQRIRDALDRVVHNAPALAVDERAEWTLRAFSGGYARAPAKRGPGLAEAAEVGPYRFLMEGLESFVAMFAVERDEPLRDEQPIAYNRHGVPYRSAMPQRMR